MTDATYERPEDAGTKPDDQVRYWLNEIGLAQKREKAWRKQAKEVIRIYEAEDVRENELNILFSNTETLAPAVYNATPRPVVRRRFKDNDPVGLAAARAGQRALEFLQDPNIEGYSSFDELMSQAVICALVPGRGVTRFKFDEVTVGGQATRTVCGVEWPWERFWHGYARRWSDVPWIAYGHCMTRDELVANFGAVGRRVELDAAETLGEDKDDSRKGDEGDNRGSLKLAWVYEVWDKRARQVRFFASGYDKGFLREVSDPHQLSGFFDCPEPLTFFRRVSGLVPKPLYALYEQQAKELNRISVRINKVVSHIKVRGMYDSTVEGINRVLELDDGELISAENVAALQGGQGKLEGALWLMPLEKLVQVLQTLYAQREQCKQVIYEVTGIADILRGASKASETLGAQEIKERWGGLRIKRLQKRVQVYVRESLRLMLELAAQHFGEEQFAQITGLQIPTAAAKQQAQMVAVAAQHQGQPPPPQAIAVLQQPGWADVLAVLRNDLTRAYRIDIETNSTVDLEATEDQKLVAEFMNAMGQFLNGVGPLVVNGTLPFEAAQTMMLSICRRFRFGDEVEDQLKQMKPPKPPEDPAKLKVQGEMMLLQQEGKQEQERFRMEMQQGQAEFLQRQREMALELQKAQMEFQMERERFQMEREKMVLDLRATMAKLTQARQGKPKEQKRAPV
ncbi:MAG: head-tail connector protein [Siphoviridae sp. ctdEk19]|nr:MAG: head-tail connector protein [Siphoviridae sp. ctdEk19]